MRLAELTQRAREIEAEIVRLRIESEPYRVELRRRLEATGLIPPVDAPPRPRVTRQPALPVPAPDAPPKEDSALLWFLRGLKCLEISAQKSGAPKLVARFRQVRGEVCA